MGLANLMRNGMRLGVKKTIGKITQPINSYTRFPEYALMEHAIHTFYNTSAVCGRLKILDVGSPKCFGLYLAWSVEMTDISSLNVDEYRLMWKAICNRAKGSAQFAIQDARSLQYAANQFDVVYSMSVLEHIEGESGDAEGVREMVRVLKPGGLLLLSVPFGKAYMEQWRKGFAGAVEKRKDETLYFFQRIYDRATLESRIVQGLKGLRMCSQWTIWRARELPVRMFRSLGENLQGLLGFMNPWMSSWVNRCASGIVDEIPGSYGEIYSAADLYGDVVLVAERAAEKLS
jgi:SAM-dependent methyltransferase